MEHYAEAKSEVVEGITPGPLRPESRMMPPMSEAVHPDRVGAPDAQAFKDSDLAPFMAYRNDPEVARYQSWDFCDEQEARAFIREMDSAQRAYRASGSSSPSNRRRRKISSGTAP